MEKYEFNHRGSFIPAFLEDDKRLSVLDEKLIVLIGQLSRDRVCWATNQKLAKYLKVDSRTVAKRIAHCDEIGYLRVSGDGENRSIRLFVNV